MSETSGAVFANITETQLVRSGAGKVYGVVVNSHSSGTMQVYDGVDNTAESKATGTLTISGGNINYATFPESIITSDETAPSDGDTVTIGSTVYRFKTTPAQAYDVAIGASAAAALDNLKLAINANGVGDGSDYYAGTEAHPSVIATTNTDTTQKVVSTTIGTTDNTLATTETSSHLSWEDTTLGGGTGSSVTGVATASSTFVIDGTTYYFTNQLSEDVTGTAVANEILWVTNDATALDNMKSAINGSGTEGTDYSTGTDAHPTVTATTNAAAAQTIEAKVFGTPGNSITTTETGDNMAWGGATLSGGTDSAKLILNTYTFATGSQVVSFPEPINFSDGLYFIIGGTADLTVVYNES